MNSQHFVWFPSGVQMHLNWQVECYANRHMYSHYRKLAWHPLKPLLIGDKQEPATLWRATSDGRSLFTATFDDSQGAQIPDTNIGSLSISEAISGLTITREFKEIWSHNQEFE